MPNNILMEINNFFIILGIAIFLYALACLWAVSADDFNYYFTKLGEILRKLVDRIKGFFKIKASEPEGNRKRKKSKS